MNIAATIEAVYVGTAHIDEVEYLEWLEGGEDTDERVAEFLRSTFDNGSAICERIYREGMAISGPTAFLEIDTATTDGT